MICIIFLPTLRSKLETAILMRVKFAFKEKVSLLSTVINDAGLSVNNCQIVRYMPDIPACSSVLNATERGVEWCLICPHHACECHAALYCTALNCRRPSLCRRTATIVAAAVVSQPACLSHRNELFPSSVPSSRHV
jgi:hypothetical protein